MILESYQVYDSPKDTDYIFNCPVCKSEDIEGTGLVNEIQCFSCGYIGN